jgi:two-component system response regulator (stage 0 sporulation protein F)
MGGKMALQLPLGFRVLVIEDDDQLRRFLSEVLRKYGAQVESAVNGKQGLDMARAESFDLVFTDIFMPEMDGFEFILNVRKIKLDVKIVAVSSGGRHGFLEVLEQMKALGAIDVLEKPFRLVELEQVLKNVVALM